MCSNVVATLKCTQSWTIRQGAHSLQPPKNQPTVQIFSDTEEDLVSHYRVLRTLEINCCDVLMSALRTQSSNRKIKKAGNIIIAV